MGIYEQTGFLMIESEKLLERIGEVGCFLDLHLHLDGSISAANARELAVLQNLLIPADEKELADLLIAGEDCRNLNDFLTKFDYPLSLLQTKEGLTLAVKNLLSELKKQGLMYAELRYAPQLHTQKGLTMEEVVQTVAEAVKESELPASVILCCMRGADNEKANEETIRLAKKYLGAGVAAADLAGAEALFPTADYRVLFRKAKELGVPFTIHAGEADGPESVRAALDMGAVRIGHGVRALEDPEVVKRLAMEQIPLECCPTSNLITCIYPAMKDYPIHALMNAGIIVTVNTDDMSVCGTDIRKEWTKLVRDCSLSPDEIMLILKNSIRASLADKSVKEKLHEKLKILLKTDSIG